MIKSFSNFILEKKLFIFQRKFRIDDLENYQVYSPILIKNWMSKYQFDKMAHAMFVSKKPVSNNLEIMSDMRVSSRDIKNKFWFDDSKKYNGILIEDSMINTGNDEIYLFIFKGNSNTNNRARQIHGFKYEGEIKRLNGLKKYGYADKWDAQGNLDKKFLQSRLPKSIDYFDGREYISLNDEEDIDFDIVPDDFKSNLFWSIKCILNGKSVDLGDFKRITGLKYKNGILSKMDDRVRKFIFNVAFHDGASNIIEEYFVLIPLDIWKTYLPDLSQPDMFKLIQSMYNELSEHYLKGERTDDLEYSWKEYTQKYSMLTFNRQIKLRFKRDTKGQLRIQSSINNSDFKKSILQNKHIRII